MLNHSCQVPSNKILSCTARTSAIVVSAILIALTAAPRLPAGTAPTFTSVTSVTFPQGIQDRFTITTTANPVAKITSSGHLPGGIKFVDNGDGTATLSGRPGGGNGLLGDYALTFTASNGVSPAATQNFTLTITRPPRITSVNNATFVVGTAKTFTITTKNTVPKSTLSFTGTLPGRVTFTPLSNGTATLSGTAAAGSKGVYFLTITAANGTLPNSVQLFTLRVQDTAPVLHAPAIISSTSTTFTVSTEGTFTVRTSGVPTATLSLTGTQPSWLSFIDNTDGTATLTGIPDPGGLPSYAFTITATNGVAPDATQSFTLFVVNPPPAITSVNNATFVVGTFGTFNVRTSPPVPSATVNFTGNILFLIFAAYVFSYAISFAGIGEKLTEFIVGMKLTTLQFYLVLFCLFTVLGCLIESLGMIVITVPLLFPILGRYGIDPILFGVVLVIYIELGQISPPIGINLFVIQSIWDGKLSEVVYGTIPFHLIMFVVLAMVIFWPELALWLPAHMSGK